MARETYTEAVALTPDDPQLHVWLADIAEVQRKPDEMRSHLDAAITTGKAEAHGLVFNFWAQSHNQAEAQQALARAEAAHAAGPRFYLEAGVACLGAASPPPSLPNFFGPSPKPAKPDARWESWGRELIERGLKDQPRLVETLRALIGLLTERRLYAYAAEYGRRVLDLTPDDLDGMVAIAMLHAMSQDKARAKEILKRAEKLARQQNRKEIVKHIRETQRTLDDPLFQMLGPSLFALGPDALDDLDELEAFFR
jgi:tetratricopeptide (TPR) repeat protein